jgi:hypothetical protein
MQDTASLPIILIGHSLGDLAKQVFTPEGLFIEFGLISSMLMLAFNRPWSCKQNDRVYSELLKAQKHSLFFAPHRGGNGTTLGQVVVSAVTFSPEICGTTWWSL